MLFQKKAYAHILVNETVGKSFLFKSLVTFLLCDAYLLWFHDKNRQYESMRSNDQQLFYALEWNFYFMLIKALINFLIYTAIIIPICFFNEKYSNRNRLNSVNITKFSMSLAMKSLILSSFGKVIVIPLVIWNPIDIYFNLAQFFTYLSNLQALIVATRMSTVKTMCVVCIALFLVFMFNSIFDLLVKSEIWLSCSTEFLKI